MKRPWQVWLVFGACLAIVLAATGWLTLKGLQLERAEAAARRQSRFEENVQLALWRMESLLAPLIAQESARPYFCYSAFYPAERAYTRMFAELGADEVRLPSPLLTTIAPYVLVHFQIDSAGRVTSPQAPAGSMRTLAESGYTTRDRIQESAVRLARLQDRLDRSALWAALPLGASTMPAGSMPAETLALAPPARSSIELSKRVSAYEHAAGSKWMTSDTCQICPEVREGMMRPMWSRDALILARKVSINHEDYVQGCQLDWPAIRHALIDDVTDLLPGADLQPVLPAAGDKPARMLAALPVQLIPGEMPVEAAAPSSIRLSLLLAWLCVLLAALAVGLVLRRAITLSERRAAFVSAVTHELRTPLTTLRMYADMLARKMVPDESKRAEYLQTMRSEANRLGHLIENVLSFSRLERGRGGAALATVSVDDLMERARPRLEQRATQAGFSMELPDHRDISASRVRADPAAVEQILFNLVDNACKYAADTSDRTIRIACQQNGHGTEIRVQDCGPGISERDAKRLFRPFSKSAGDAANSAPGVGLGLALSRRLARDMRGDLRLDRSNGPGACFVLTLTTAKGNAEFGMRNAE
jgi:signal transduction histidine kinase